MMILEDWRGKEIDKKDKIGRILGLYKKLINGDVLYKSEEAQKYGVNKRSIQRDIDDIRDFIETEGSKNGETNYVVYDRVKKGYRLEKKQEMNLSNSEILAICKILLDSRAFTKQEMDSILQKVIDCCVPKCNQKIVTELIRNEQFHYIEPRHKTKYIDKMWEIGEAIQNHQCIEIKYKKLKDKRIVRRKLKPIAIMFSEFYFYLAAFIVDEEIKQKFDVQNDSFPTIYRMDRINDINILEERFKIPYRSRFEEGEFRKRIQFMYGGKLQTVKFIYCGMDIDAVLDRLPTAKIIAEENQIYKIKAEVFGDGIDMWLRSQGENIKQWEE